jgi:hypothetical protein
MLERLICAAFGHRYVVERVLNHGARKVGCTRCGKHWAMHDGTRSFVPWDGEFEEFYAPGGILAETSGDVPPNPLCKDCHQGSRNGIHGQRIMWNVMKKSELDCLAETLSKLLYP